MERYIQKLREYVDENKILFEKSDAQPCLDALWQHYSEHHSMNSKAAKESFRMLRAELEGIPAERSDTVFAGIGCLCAEYERIAFAAGVRLGAQLMLELQDR